MFLVATVPLSSVSAVGASGPTQLGTPASVDHLGITWAHHLRSITYLGINDVPTLEALARGFVTGQGFGYFSGPGIFGLCYGD